MVPWGFSDSLNKRFVRLNALDDHLVAQHLVQIQRVDPLRVEARQHLINHDQDVHALLGRLLDSQVGPLVRQPVGDIGLERRPRRQRELHAETLVVVGNDLLKCLLLDKRPVDLLLLVVDRRIHEHRRHQFGRRLLEQMVVIERLGDGMGWRKSRGTCRSGSRWASASRCRPPPVADARSRRAGQPCRTGFPALGSQRRGSGCPSRRGRGAMGISSMI